MKINNIDEAIILLKDGYFLKVKDNIFLKYYNGFIYLSSENLKLRLTVKDYLQIFNHQEFYLIKINDEEIDYLKDLEYYNFKYK